jgi:hypothetical protein
MSDLELSNWIKYLQLTYPLTSIEQIKDNDINMQVLIKSAAKFKKVLDELNNRDIETNLEALNIKVKGKQSKEVKPDINEWAQMFEEEMNKELEQSLLNQGNQSNQSN